MKDYSVEQIQAEIQTLWRKDNQDYDHFKITIDKQQSHIDITLTKMYDYPGLKFAQLKALSEFFGTDNIDDVQRYKAEGCPTCDYGSKYEFTIRIKPDG